LVSKKKTTLRVVFFWRGDRGPRAVRFGTHSVSPKTSAFSLVFWGSRGLNRRFDSKVDQQQKESRPQGWLSFCCT